MNDFSILDELLDGSPKTRNIPIIEIAEDGTQIDPRYTRLSFSSNNLLHACPRKFQLKKLTATASEDSNTNVTFAFGHAVGAGAVELLRSKDLHKSVWAAFLAWDVDFDAINEKQQKSLAYAILALEIFEEVMKEEPFNTLEIMHYNGEPAIELSFSISFPGTLAEYHFRGFLDALLQDTETEEAIVFENKTSSGNYVNHYSYKNSAQATGYSVIVDAIEQECSSYEVLYNVYMTKLKRYETFPFVKSSTLKARWLKSIFHDIDEIERYVRSEGNYGHWPMNGESCTDFGRVCEFMDVCTLNTKNLMTPLTEEHLVDFVQPQFIFNVEELLGDSNG